MINKNDANDPDTLRKGKVTFLNEFKGYGFIKDSETQENIFVFKKDLELKVQQGSIVNFEVIAGKKGFTAVHVKLFK